MLFRIYLLAVQASSRFASDAYIDVLFVWCAHSLLHHPKGKYNMYIYQESEDAKSSMALEWAPNASGA